MSNFRFELNPAGVRELMQSSEMMSIVEGKARQAIAALGPGYEMDTMTGKNRVNAEVRAATAAAALENGRTNSILKAVGATRA